MTKDRRDWRNDEEGRVAELLDELGPADPPDSLVPHIMARIAAAHDGRAASAGTSVHHRTGGRAMTRKIVWTLAAAAAVALAVFVVRGFPPAGPGTEGTIGAAKRYQAQQLADKDVVLGDAEAQAFLQSDIYTQLINDEAARQLLADANVRVALRNDALARELADSEVRSLFLRKELYRFMADPALKSALRRGLDDAGLKRGLDDASLKRSVSEASMRRQISDADLKRAMSDQDLRRFLDDAAMRKVMARPAIWAALEDANLMRSLADDNLRMGLSSRAFAAAVASRGFSNALRASKLEAELMRH
jgi:hypothetical protein